MSEQTTAQPQALIHVVDDDTDFRTNLLRMLNVEGFNAVGYPSAGDYLIAQIKTGETTIASCLLLEITRPGLSGINLMKALASRETTPPIIFITERDDLFTYADVRACGALDYVMKPIATERVLAAVRKAIGVDAARRAARAELHELRSRYNGLSPVERLIFFGIVNHQLNAQMAVALGTNERTINTRRANVMDKLKLGSIAELVKAARLLERMRGQDIDPLENFPTLKLARSRATHPRLGRSH